MCAERNGIFPARDMRWRTGFFFLETQALPFSSLTGPAEPDSLLLLFLLSFRPCTPSIYLAIYDILVQMDNFSR